VGFSGASIGEVEESKNETIGIAAEGQGPPMVNGSIAEAKAPTEAELAIPVVCSRIFVFGR
jgi:hypothetical protein